MGKCGNFPPSTAVQRGMIFLDTDTHYLIAESRTEMVQALLEHLPDEPDNQTLAALAAACLECEELDVVVIET